MNNSFHPKETKAVKVSWFEISRECHNIFNCDDDGDDNYESSSKNLLSKLPFFHFHVWVIKTGRTRIDQNTFFSKTILNSLEQAVDWG